MGRVPAREFVDRWMTKQRRGSTRLSTACASTATGCRGKFVKKLTNGIFELRVQYNSDRIFRVLFFYQPGMLIVITSGFQKKRNRPAGRDYEAEQLRKLWMKHRNRYTGSQKEEKQS